MKLIKSQKVCHWRQTSLVRVCHMTDCKMIGVIRLLWLVFCALWMVFWVILYLQTSSFHQSGFISVQLRVNHALYQSAVARLVQQGVEPLGAPPLFFKPLLLSVWTSVTPPLLSSLPHQSAVLKTPPASRCGSPSAESEPEIQRRTSASPAAAGHVTRAGSHTASAGSAANSAHPCGRTQPITLIEQQHGLTMNQTFSWDEYSPFCYYLLMLFKEILFFPSTTVQWPHEKAQHKSTKAIHMV